MSAAVGRRMVATFAELADEKRRQEALAARMTVNAALVGSRPCPECEGEGVVSRLVECLECVRRRGRLDCPLCSDTGIAAEVRETCQGCEGEKAVDWCLACDDRLDNCRSGAMHREQSEDGCAVTLHPDRSLTA